MSEWSQVDIFFRRQEMDNGIQRLYSRENELLLLCARTDMAEDHMKKVQRLVQEKLDWTYLLATAAQHGLLSLLFKNLSSCHDVLPHPVLIQLRTFYMTNSARNEYLSRELIALLEGFKAEKIDALPFKGPALAAMAYGDISLRHFIDLDFLVMQPQLRSAFHVMKARGFTLKGSKADQDQKPSAHKKTYTFTRGEGMAEVRVDLQSLIIGDHFAVPIDDDSLWERVTTISLTGKPVPSLGTEDLLIILCIHGSKHLWEKTKWICDVAELIGRHESTLNWRFVHEQACRLRGQHMLELGLHMVNFLRVVGSCTRANTSRVSWEACGANTLIPVTAAWLSDELFNPSTKVPNTFKEKAFHRFLRADITSRFLKYLYLCLMPLPRKYWARLPHPRIFAWFYATVGGVRLLGRHVVRSLKVKQSIARWVKLS